jgi:hypothetical protein
LIDLNRLENESFLDYAERLIEARENNLIDIDKAEVWDMLFGEKVSSDHARKCLAAVKKLITKLRNEGYENITEEEILKELDVKKIELQKEKYKIQSLRLDLNRIIRESSRNELLIEEFINTIKQTESISIPDFKPLQKQKSNSQYILSFADSHFGKEFESITNEYNLEVVYDRFNQLLTEVVNEIEENKIEKLIVLALGDLIEGMCLRFSQLTSLKIGITNQTVSFMRFLVKWLSKLSEYVEIEYYSTPYSNHGQIRPFGTKANEFVKEDMEQIIFAYVYDMLQNNDRIEVKDCPNKHVIFKIFNYNIIATHGHDIKDIDDFIKDISDKYKIFFDYGFFAHKHRGATKTVGEGVTNNCEVINIPSIMGCDEYADDLLVGSKPGATLIEFTENQGKRKTIDIILK